MHPYFPIHLEEHDMENANKPITVIWVFMNQLRGVKNAEKWNFFQPPPTLLNSIETN